MLSHHNKSTFVRVTSFFFIGIALAGVYVFFLIKNFYSQHERRGISIEEANSLALYDICLPTYLPSNVVSGPYITYDEEFGDPIDSKASVEYFQVASTRPALKIYYIHTLTTVKLDALRSTNDRSPAHYWLSFWARKFHNVDVENSEIKIKDSFLEENASYWRFEIIEPQIINTVLIEWTSDQVFYQLFSIFPLDETQKIASSIEQVCK